MMWQTTMNPVSRRLIRIMPCDDDDTAECSTSCSATTSRRAGNISSGTAGNFDDADIFDGTIDMASAAKARFFE